jgi:hypothetical protein
MFDIDINITEALAQHLVEQGISTKESDYISFVKTKTDNIISDIIGTSEKDAYLYVETNKRLLRLLYKYLLRCPCCLLHYSFG